MPELTWEQSVAWLRRQPDQKDLVRDCYYDDPLLEAARRFAEGDEWRAVLTWLPTTPGRAIDLGAGRGISSFALARNGWRVVALEPDPSPLVGTAAISRLAREAGTPITVCRAGAESLPFDDESFELVYGRQVLHHAADLTALCREAARVLVRGGRLVATREHVITSPADLAVFLDRHPLHRFYGGENAFPLQDYTDALEGAGLRLLRVLGPYDSVINYFPTTHEQWRHACRRPLADLFGARIAAVLTSEGHAIGRWMLRALAGRLSRRCNKPGRLCSFIAEKTGGSLGRLRAL